MASEERRTAEHRRRNSDGMLNREEKSWWHVKRRGQLNREKKESWWHVKRGWQLSREEGKLMTSEERRTAKERRRKADYKWRE
jgi:hypothetical protein